MFSQTGTTLQMCTRQTGNTAHDQAECLISVKLSEGKYASSYSVSFYKSTRCL